jgi:hypothetical protein
MPTDEQYGRRIGDLLHDEIHDVHAAPGLAHTVRNRLARRTRTVRAAIAVPMAVAAAAAVFAVVGHPHVPADRAARTDAGPPGAPVRIQTVAYVRDQTLHALRGAANYVIFSRTSYDTGHYDVWSDRSTQRVRLDLYTQIPPAQPATRNSDGSVTAHAPSRSPSLGPLRLQQAHTTRGSDGNQEEVTVDYDSKSWSRRHISEKNPPSSLPDITDADSVRAAIDDGKLELVGQEKTDGHDTLHLRIYATRRGYRVDMWVDATTYLPVRETSSVIGQDSGQRQPSATVVVTTYAWLPRTAENLAKLTLTPPAGFTQMR